MTYDVGNSRPGLGQVHISVLSYKQKQTDNDNTHVHDHTLAWAGI